MSYLMNRKLLFLVAFLIIIPCACRAGVDLPKKGSVPHPRLIMKAEDESAVRELIASDIFAAAIDSAICENCRTRLSEPMVTNDRDAAGVRLKNAGLIEKDLVLLSYAARIHSDDACRQRAIDEMLTVCAFPDWSPEHFLDPSEIAFGVSICYDWLYDSLTKKQRKTVREALLYNAILPSFEKHPDHYFYSPTNWSSVCNCGIVAAALCVMDEYPVEAGKVIDRCIDGNRKVLASYNPVGGYPEGYGYWSFGTNHEVLLIECLRTALGSDFGLVESSSGFKYSASFILHMNGPFFMGFNYGDNAPEARFHPAVYWFARETSDPSLLYMEQKFIRSGKDITWGCGPALPPALVWYSKLGKGLITPPTSLFYENPDPKIPLFIYHSDWESKDAAFLGIRGGSTRKVNHSHIDVGSFVFYQDQVRWVADLGTPNYVLAEKHIGHLPLFTIKQDSKRWDVLREGAVGHSIVTFDNLRPTIDCDCAFIRTFHTKAQKGALIDLTSMYPGQVKNYLRMIYLDAEDNLVVTEKIAGGDTDRTVRWNLVSETNATILEDGKVLLEQNGKTRTLTISCDGKPLKAKVVEPVTDKPYDEPNPGMKFIQCEFTLHSGQTMNIITTIRK